MVERAAGLVEALAVDEATSLYRQVLQKQPRCLAALNGLADCLMSLGDQSGAVDVLRKSVQLQPEGDAERYLNLGQLVEGAEALQWLEVGVRILRAERETLAASPGGSDDEVCGPASPATALSLAVVVA